MTKRVIFVTGIDTNIGKTYATVRLFRHLDRNAETRIITQKMIQTGCERTSEDIDTHRRLLGLPYQEVDDLGLTAPIILPYPASPHLSARLEGVNIDISKLTNATKALLYQYDYDIVLLEGAGGLMVPITEDYLTIDYIVEHGYHVALTTSGRLGSINHTLLSIEACLRRNITIDYLIYNRYPLVDEIIETDTRSYLERYLKQYSPETQILDLEQC